MRVVAGRSTPTGVEILRATSAALPDDFAARDPEGRAAAIRVALGEAGGGNGRTVLVLPRSMAILRDFDLPGGSPEEVLQMAHFQIEKEMPLPLDQTRYSYVETPAPDGRLHVAVAAVPKEQIDPLVEAVEAAGGKVQAAYVSSFGLASLLSDKDLEGGSALIGLADGMLEVLVVDGGALAHSRSVPMKDASAEALATEVNRTVLAYGARGGGRSIKRVLVAGEGRDAEAMVGALRERIGGTVEGLVLNGSVARREGVAVGLEAVAAAGVCVGVLRGGRMPNVLRTPAIDKKFRFKPWQRLAILGGVIVIGFFVWSRMALSDLQARSEELRIELKRLDGPVAAAKKMEDQLRTARQWGGNRYAWIETVNAISKAIKPSEVWLTSLTAGEGSPLRITGKARDDRRVDELVAELQKDDRFGKVTKERANPNGAKDDYKYDFSLVIELPGVTPPKRK